MLPPPLLIPCLEALLPEDEAKTLWAWDFWKAALERAVRTAAQAAAGAIGAGVIVGEPYVNWNYVGTLTWLGALLSVLTSIGTGVVSGGGPGITEIPKPNGKP